MALSANTQINALIDAAREMFVTRPQLYIAQLRGKLQDLSGTNFEMGCQFAERGDWRDAAMRFRITVKLDPNFAQAWHNLGVCLMQLKDREGATQAFQRVLALDPANDEARYMLATVNPTALRREEWPARMPRTMIHRFFGATAPVYARVEAQNGYTGPMVCEQKLLPHLATKTGLNVIDLGCGVGLAATTWRDKALTLTGVDVVAGMVAEARNMSAGGIPLFNHVIEGDLYAPQSIAIPAASADVALVCNVTQFLGDLNGLMQGLSTWLKPAGLAAITVEPAPPQAAFGVVPGTGRFGHSAAYLQEEAQRHGFELLVQERVTLYPDLPAGLVILRKK